MNKIDPAIKNIMDHVRGELWLQGVRTKTTEADKDIKESINWELVKGSRTSI